MIFAVGGWCWGSVRTRGRGWASMPKPNQLTSLRLSSPNRISWLLLPHLPTPPPSSNPSNNMSGFEIAGIVLGAFPLAISALRYYQTDIAPLLGIWRNVCREHKKCESDLRFHHLRYRGTLKQLLLPLVVDDETIEHLLGNPVGESWKAPEVAEALKQRLQDSYELYFDTIQDMQQTMRKLNQRLDRVTRAPSTRTTEPSMSATKLRVGRHVWRPMHLRQRFSRTLKKGLTWTRETGRAHTSRATFVLGDATRKRLFTALRDCNDKLEKLLQISDDTSDVQARRSATSLRESASTLGLSSSWDDASQLYRALSGSWDCKCRERHSARLLLHHGKAAKNEFRLVLSYGSPQEAKPSQWIHCCLKITGQVAKRTWGVENDKTALLMFTPRKGAAAPRKSALKGSNTHETEPAPRCNTFPPPLLSRNIFTDQANAA